jgi:hypothetical protein
MKFGKTFFASIFAISTAILVSCSEDPYSVDPAVTQENTANAAVLTPSVKAATLGLQDVLLSSVVLYAGQHYTAGTVNVYQTDTNNDLTYDAVKVVYALTGGWVFNPNLTEQVKFYLGTGVPASNPGGYPYKYTITDGATTYVAVVPFTSLGFDGCAPLKLNIAAHADVMLSSDNSTQTAWGKGTTEFGQGWGSFYDFTLTDKTPPTASDVTTGPSESLQCLSQLPAVDPLVITDEADNCGVPTVTYKEGSEVQTGTCPVTVTRTYVVTDGNGNSVEVTHTIVILDVTAPVLTWADGEGFNVSNVCSAEGLFNTPLASDNCGAVITPSYTDSEVRNNEGKLVSLTRTWSAVDGCGNTSNTLTQTVAFDVTSPVLNFPNGELRSAPCGTDPATMFTVPYAVDEPSLVPVQVGTDVVVVTGNTTSTTRTWRVADACGNETVNSQTVVITCDPVTPPPGDFEEGAGTSWAFFNGSVPFNTFTVSNNWGWTTRFDNNDASYGTRTATLYVGAGRNDVSKAAAVGEIKVTYTATNVHVEYRISSLCDITSVHLWVGRTLLPMNKKSYVSSPGQFNLVTSPYSGTTYTADIANPGGSSFYLAAHADIVIK